MKYLSKFSSEIIGVIVLCAAYIATRLYNLLHLPIFTDEAIYIRWSQIAQNDASWRFISLTDGKQPSFVWLNMITLSIFNDPLIAGRMVSVFAGLGTLLGVFALTQILFGNKKLSLLSAFLYVIYPFSFVYDRLAIYDSLVSVFFVWSLFFGVLLVKKSRLDTAMVLGFVLGGAVLTKSSGFLSIYLSPIFLLLLSLKRKGLYSRIVKTASLFLLSFLIAYIMYSVQRLSPFFHIIEQKNATFVYPVAEWIEHPVEYLVSNLRGMVDWVIVYMTIPILILSFSSFLFGLKKFFMEKAFLLLWFLGPFMGLAVFGKLIYPRFIFFMTIPLLILASYSLFVLINKTKNIYLKALVIFAFTALYFYADFKILTDFKNAPVPRIDLEQFVNGWPAGGGVRESIEFFESEAKENEIVIATEGTFGLMPYSYEIFLSGNPNIEVKGYWPIEDTIPQEVESLVAEKDVYFVFYQPCPSCDFPGDAPDTWPLEKIEEFKKGNGEVSLSIYKVIKRE